jgi:hypothetical protein
MALISIESFDSIASLPELGRGHISTTTSILETGVVKGGYQCLKNAYNDSFIYYYPGRQTAKRTTFSFWFLFDDDSQSAVSFIASFCSTNSGFIHARLRLRTDLKLELRGQGSTDLGLISAQTLAKDTWYHFEITHKPVTSSSSGDYVLNVDGVEWLSSTGDDVNYSTHTYTELAQFHGPSSSGGGSFYYDELIVFDDDGSGDFSDGTMGALRATSINPDGNGTTNEFVGQDVDSTDNFENVDEDPWDEDTTYNESSTVGHQDLYAFDDLPGTVDTIYAVQAGCWARKDTDTIRGIKNLVYINSSDYLGDERWLSNGGYVTCSHIWLLNPDDAAAWEAADVNGAEFGIEITT